MRTETLEKKLANKQLLHVSIGKGGHVTWALARNVGLDGEPGRVSILYNDKGWAFVLRFPTSDEVPQEMSDVRQVGDLIVEVNGMVYTRNGLYDLK